MYAYAYMYVCKLTLKYYKISLVTISNGNATLDLKTFVF